MSSRKYTGEYIREGKWSKWRKNGKAFCPTVWFQKWCENQLDVGLRSLRYIYYYPPPWGNETATRSTHREWDDYVEKKRKEYKRKRRKNRRNKKNDCERNKTAVHRHIHARDDRIPCAFLTWSPFGLFFCASGARQRAPFTFLLIIITSLYGSRWNYSVSLWSGWKRKKKKKNGDMKLNSRVQREQIRFSNIYKPKDTISCGISPVVFTCHLIPPHIIGRRQRQKSNAQRVVNNTQP